MKVKNREVIKHLIIEHERGYFMDYGNTSGFYQVVLEAAPEDYDFSNWGLTDLKDMRDALVAFIEKIEK